jgi:Zn-dependent M28 family amino/carboxypeptidase
MEGESQNVIGMLPGSDPKLKSEYVVLTAHLDHRAIGEPRDGALPGAEIPDDGSGVAALLDIAGALHESQAKLRRSLLFVFVTGEEKGLLGSVYFAQYPPVDPGSMVAQLNVDLLPPLHSLRAITVYGMTESDLGAETRAVGARLGVRIQPDPEPQWDLAVRSDQYSLIRRGVPALAFKVGYENRATEEPLAWTRMTARYRAPLDGAGQAADKSSASRFDDVVVEVAKAVANRTERPHWLATSYFKQFSR